MPNPAVNQHCHTRQPQLNLCKSVGRVCPLPMAVLIWARSAELAKLVLKECEGIQVDDEDTRINGENLGIETDQKRI